MAKFVRLISKSKVDGYEDRLRAGVQKCLDDQVAQVNATMRAHGITTTFTAAASKKSTSAAVTAAIVVPFAWDAAHWDKVVAEYMTPIARDVATDAAGDASAAFGGEATSLWGMATGGDDMVTAILNQTKASGKAIGDRLNTAAISDDVEGNVADVLFTAPDIMGDLIGAMGQATANMATSDLANFVISKDAPTYLSAQKSWINQGDDKVRETHQDVDDVAINEQFAVGGGMDGPGDPDGPDEETCNCRCHVEYSGLVPDGADLPDMEGENA